jgi:integrase
MTVAPQSALCSWEHPKKSGIRIREIINSHAGEDYSGSYLVIVPAKFTGKLRLRRQFKDRADAENWAEETFTGYRQQGHAFFGLSEHERQEIGSLMPKLREQGLSIAEAVRFALKRMKPEGRTKTLRQVVEEVVASKSQRYERGDLRERSYRDFRHRSEKFTKGFEGRLAGEITGAEVKTWLNGLTLGTRSNRNYLAVIGEVFRYATQKRYVAGSPLDDLTDIDRKELCGREGEAKEPSILTPHEAEKLLTIAQEHPELDLLGAVTLALFCGLRTEEIKRLDWDQVRLGEATPVVTIGAKIAKKRRIRHVEIPVNALPWLRLIPSRKGPVAQNDHFNDYQKRFKKLLNLAKFKKWESNAMRHSFGSYHYALYGNPLETSRLLGHKTSDQVLFDHYRALATKVQAEAYFAIIPPVKQGKVIQFAS